MDTARSTIWTDLGAALSLGAGLVHAVAAGTHSDDAVMAGLFATTAVAQVCVAVTLLTGPTRRNLAVGAAVNAATVLAWVASRPLVGVQGLAAAAMGAGAAAVIFFTVMPHVPFPATRRVTTISTDGAAHEH